MKRAASGRILGMSVTRAGEGSRRGSRRTSRVKLEAACQLYLGEARADDATTGLAHGGPGGSQFTRCSNSVDNFAVPHERAELCAGLLL